MKLAPIPRVRVPSRDVWRGYYEAYAAVTDVVLLARLSALQPHELYGRDGVYAISKRPLSKKELAAHKLAAPMPTVPQRSR